MTVEKEAAVPHQTFEVTIALSIVIIAMVVISIYPNFLHDNEFWEKRHRFQQWVFRFFSRVVGIILMPYCLSDFVVRPTNGGFLPLWL